MAQRKSEYDRRSFHHNYYERFIYHIIIKKKDGFPDFGAIRGKVNGNQCEKAPYTFPFDSGRAIIDGLKFFESIYPEIRKFQYVLMPDHLHLIIYKTEKNNIHLDDYINELKSISCNIYNKRISANFSHEDMFQYGYTDKALYDKVSLDNWINYVRKKSIS